MIDEEKKKLFVGKKIKDIYVDGFYIELLLEDNTKLSYYATDGGYSTYEITMG